jgi:hypothetical protein
VDGPHLSGEQWQDAASEQATLKVEERESRVLIFFAK